MAILRYAFLPGSSFDVAEPGAFDFAVADVLEVLEGEKREQEAGLHISGSRRATYALLLKTLTWVREQAASRREFVEWHPSSRSWPIERLQRERHAWSIESDRITNGDIQADFEYPAWEEDEFFGIYLRELVYAKRFASCRCPACGANFAPGECAVEKWSIWGSGGEKLVCPRGHALHSRNTIEFLDWSDDCF